MGSALGHRLVRDGVTVLTSLNGRGAASTARAAASGMRHADDAEIVDKADVILSIVPPGEALGIARRFAPFLARSSRKPLFVDCNAIDVTTISTIEGVIEAVGASFVDGALIGLPPKGDEKGPALYCAGSAAAPLAALIDYGLDIRLMDGPNGAASALKLSYAGITKGLVAVGAAMILAAERAGAGQALKDELAASQPDLLARFGKSLPDMYPKAYRWVEEMHAIAAFVGPSLPEARVYDAAAGLYERLAGSREDTDTIDAFLRR